MQPTTPKKKSLLALLPVGIGVLILVVMGVVSTRSGRDFVARRNDAPPVIAFTWSPSDQPVSLLEARATLRITDDYGIDFSTYKMRIAELDKTLDYPIEGVVGNDWTQPISFSLIAEDPKLVGVKTLTVEISVADDRGQVSTLTKVIPLR